MTYGDIKIGQTETLSHTITQSDVDGFIALTGDVNKLHTTTKYGSPAVHGMLSASFISTIIGTKLPGDGALWFSQSLAFTNMVRVGDTINVRATVKQKKDIDKMIVLDINITNQHGETVVSGISKVMIMEESYVDVELPVSDIRILVVGGTGGIGREVVRELSQRGYCVTATYLNDKEGAEALRDECGCKIGQLDVLCDKFYTGVADVLINCSGMTVTDTRVTELDTENLINRFNFEVCSNLTLVKRFYEHMKQQKYGKIIFIGSSMMDNRSGNLSCYITCKEALWGFTKALSFELAPQGIRVNMVSPSLINTELTENISYKNKLILESKTPLRRTTTTVEVAKVIGFLVSQAGDSITGQNIKING
jgi:3-oxoacyl-[acyl-carrier protein] reductase